MSPINDNASSSSNSPISTVIAIRIAATTATPTSDTEADITITSTMQSNWWTTIEQAGTNAGLIYSLLGGGDRLSTVQPNGANSSPIREGFNRYYEVGDGTNGNSRTALMGNSGEWPNPIRFNLTTTNMAEHGDVATLDIYFQWAQPTNFTQTVQVLADPDLDPLNGHEIILEQGFASGTGIARVGHGTIDVNLDGGLIPAGNYQLLVNMAAGGRNRFLYAPQFISVAASTLPLTLDIALATNSIALLGINGLAGQTAVVEMSIDGLPWLPIATNALTSSRWEIMEPVDPNATLTLFRAVVANP